LIKRTFATPVIFHETIVVNGGGRTRTPNHHVPKVGEARVIDPSNGEVITEVATAGESECDAAVTAAHRAFPAWAKTAPRVRAEILRKAFELMIAESENIAKLISMENGKVFFLMPKGKWLTQQNSLDGFQKKRCELREILDMPPAEIKEFLLHINLLEFHY